MRQAIIKQGLYAPALEADRCQAERYNNPQQRYYLELHPAGLIAFQCRHLLGLPKSPRDVPHDDHLLQDFLLAWVLQISIVCPLSLFCYFFYYSVSSETILQRMENWKHECAGKGRYLRQPSRSDPKSSTIPRAPAHPNLPYGLYLGVCL